MGIRQPKLGYFPQPTWRTTWGPLSATWGRALCRLGYGSVMFDHDGGSVPVRLFCFVLIAQQHMPHVFSDRRGCG